MVFPQKPTQFIFMRVDGPVVRKGLKCAHGLPLPVAALRAHDATATKTEPFGKNFRVQAAPLFLTEKILSPIDWGPAPAGTSDFVRPEPDLHSSMGLAKSIDSDPMLPTKVRGMDEAGIVIWNTGWKLQLETRWP